MYLYVIYRDGLFTCIVYTQSIFSHCSVGWSEVHIVHWGGLEFTLLSYTLKLFSYVRGVKFLILKRIGEFSCSEFLYGLEFTLLWRQIVKSVEDSWFRWVWGPNVIYQLELRSWAWNLKEKNTQQIALVFDEI